MTISMARRFVLLQRTVLLPPERIPDVQRQKLPLLSPIESVSILVKEKADEVHEHRPRDLPCQSGRPYR